MMITKRYSTFLNNGLSLGCLMLAALPGCDTFLRENPAYVPWLVNKCAQEQCGAHPNGGTCAKPNGAATTVFCSTPSDCDGAFRIVEFSCMPTTPDPMPMPNGPTYTEGQKGTKVEHGTDAMGAPMVCTPLDGSAITYLNMSMLEPDLSKVDCEWLYEADVRTKRVIAFRDVPPETPGTASLTVTEYRGAAMVNRTIDSGRYYRADGQATKWVTTFKRFYDTTVTGDFRSSSSPSGSTLAQTPAAFPQCDSGGMVGTCVF